MKHNTNKQILGMHTWCDHIVSGLNLFPCNNSIYLLINPVSFKVLFVGFYMETQPLNHSLKNFVKCIVWNSTLCAVILLGSRLYH